MPNNKISLKLYIKYKNNNIRQKRRSWVASRLDPGCFRQCPEKPNNLQLLYVTQ